MLGRRAGAAVLGSILLAAACTGGSSSPTAPTTTIALSTTTSLPRGNVDGQLKIGILLPESGAGQIIGASMTAAVQLAVDEINTAGGVNGQPVVLAHADEGSNQADGAKALDDLLTKQRVDAVVGPASSKIALALLDKIVDARVATCSPTATAIALSDYPDRGYFFRTIASDRLESKVLAKVIDETGGRSTAIVAPDDEYGSQLSVALTTSLKNQDTKVTGVTTYDATTTDPNTDYKLVASAALADHPDTIAVIGLPDAGGKIIAALEAAGTVPSSIFVTDGMRQPGLSEKVQPAKPESVAGIQGAAPASVGTGASWFADAFKAAHPDVPDYYASYAYDCTNLIALAAQAAQTDDASKFVEHVIPTSKGGVSCANFSQCAPDLAQGRNIDLNGASGRIELLDNGDASYGTYDVFKFGADGTEQSVRAKTETLP